MFPWAHIWRIRCPLDKLWDMIEMWKKWKGRLERRNSGKNLKGRVTSGTEFRKILSPLPWSSFTLIGHHYSEAKDTKINTIITISTKISWVWWDEHWESKPLRRRWSSSMVFSPLEQAIVRNRGGRYIIQDISYQLASHMSSQQTFLCNYQCNDALPKTNQTQLDCSFHIGG